MKVKEIEPILIGILEHADPADVIHALRNELNQNDRHFGSFEEQDMKDMIKNLEEAAFFAHRMFHGE